MGNIVLILSCCFLFSQVLAADPRSRTPTDMTKEALVEEKDLEELYKELELLEKLENSTDNRESRGLLKKLSFLAGLKVGSLIQSSGTLAASHSVRVFGKVMNSALSVSYGSADDLIEPLPQVIQHEKPSLESEVSEDKEGTIIKAVASEETIINTEDPINVVRRQFLKKHDSQVERLNQRFLKNGFTSTET